MNHRANPHHPHPVVACAQAVTSALDEVAEVDPLYMDSGEKQAALLSLTTAASRLEELRLRVLAGAEDVAADTAARDAASWLAHAARLDGPAARRDQRLARALDTRWRRVAAGLASGDVNRAQAEVIVHALEDLAVLPEDLATEQGGRFDGVDADLLGRAEARLVELAADYTPRQLRILGRRVLEVVAPEVAEEAEARLLEKEHHRALRRTYLTTRKNGDGTTDVKIRLADAAADRLLSYLHAFTSPRQTPRPGVPVTDRRPYDQRLGHAFTAFLEAADPARMPLHGGDATTVIVTIDLDQLRGQLDEHGVGLVGDEPITAAEARRLACTAKVLPAVLGGDSEILDLGRARRLYSPALRKAMAMRDVTCRAEGCEIPAAWCEAHHLTAWARGGRTDLADGALLCSWHHHRAHDHRYRLRQSPTGRISFHRLT